MSPRCMAEVSSFLFYRFSQLLYMGKAKFVIKGDWLQWEKQKHLSALFQDVIVRRRARALVRNPVSCGERPALSSGISWPVCRLLKGRYNVNPASVRFGFSVLLLKCNSVWYSRFVWGSKATLLAPEMRY